LANFTCLQLKVYLIYLFHTISVYFFQLPHSSKPVSKFTNATNPSHHRLLQPHTHQADFTEYLAVFSLSTYARRFSSFCSSFNVDSSINQFFEAHIKTYHDTRDRASVY